MLHPLHHRADRPITSQRIPEGLLGNVKGIFQGGKSVRDEPTGELERQVEVRFEWTRSERGGKRKVGRNSAVLTNSDHPSVDSPYDREKKTKRSSASAWYLRGTWSSPDRYLQNEPETSPTTRLPVRWVKETTKYPGRRRMTARKAVQRTRKFLGHTLFM